MAILVKKNIGLYVATDNAYAKVLNVVYETNPNPRLAIDIGFYVSKEAREKDIVQRYIESKMYIPEHDLPEGFVIDAELKSLMGVVTDEDYLNFFKRCFYTQEQVKTFIQNELTMLSGGILNRFTFYVYASEGSFPTDLSLTGIKAWVYSSLKTIPAYRNALYTPGHPEYLNTIEDDLESEEDVLARYKAIYPFL